MQKRPCVLVTGAAAGIGYAIAKTFAAQGWLVGVADIDEVGVARVAEQLGKQAIAFHLNVCDVDAWQQVLAQFWQQTGRLDLLVNNAGVLSSGDFGNIPLAAQHRMIDINVKGVINGCHCALPYLQQTKRARVINLASASAIYGQPSLATYSASKFAVRGLTEALDLEWETFGIRVMDILPLFVQTAMVKDMDAKAIDTLGVKLTADDVAQTVWKAASAPRWNKRVHWTVGLDTRLFYSLVGLMPDWINRSTTRWIASKH
jgi:NAD(P)-dependent dehydrogenase (short-subunit alcohol dehydrogenase family)